MALSIKFFLVVCFLGLPALSSAGRFSSFRDFVKQQGKLYLTNVTPAPSSTTTTIPPSTTTTITTFTSSESNSYPSWLWLAMKVLGGSFGSFGVAITFKFVRNGCSCKKSWFTIKFIGYHDKKDNDEDQAAQHEIIDLVVFNPSAPINPVE